MPIHDWTDDRGWDSLHAVWQNQLLELLQAELPEGYRAYIGSVPALAIDAPNGRPDVSVRAWQPPANPTRTRGVATAPDAEAVALFELDSQTAVHIERHGQLVAAVEIVSPRNKDRNDARERYARRYFGYIRQGIHLLLIDLLPRPAGFSFADVIAGNLGFDLAPCPTPFAVSFRVGEPVPEGTILAVWRRPLKVGEILPSIPLALTVHDSVDVDLERTYRESAKRVYLN